MTKQTETKRWKDTSLPMFVNIILVFFITFAVVFLVDGYRIHSVPASANVLVRGEPLMSNAEYKFDITKSETVYADARIIGAHFDPIPEEEAFLVEKDGENHLLRFTQHPFTRRWALENDVVIAPDFSGEMRLDGTTSEWILLFENGRVRTQDFNDIYLRVQDIYLCIAVAVTALESFLFWWIRRKLWGAPEEYVPASVRDTAHVTVTIPEDADPLDSMRPELWENVKPPFNYVKFGCLTVVNVLLGALWIYCLMTDSAPFGLGDWFPIVLFCVWGITVPYSWKMVGDWKFDREQMAREARLKKKQDKP